jgi:hypothetical protein
LRQSPRRHRVRSHIRHGFRVRSYVRGRGLSNPRVKRTVLEKDQDFLDTSYSPELREYTVLFQYGEGDKVTTETVKSHGHNVPEAILNADKDRKRKRERPTGVIAHNLIGDIVGKLAAWGTGGVKKALQTYQATREKSKIAEAERARQIRELQATRKAAEQYYREA